MAVCPLPTANSVPDAHEPPSCIPTPNMNDADEQAEADRRERRCRRARRARRHRRPGSGEQRRGHGDHQHVGAQPLALAYGDQLAPRRGEPEPAVEQHEAERQADGVEHGRDLPRLLGDDPPRRAVRRRRARRRPPRAGGLGLLQWWCHPYGDLLVAARAAWWLRTWCCSSPVQGPVGRAAIGPTGVMVPPGNHETSVSWPAWPALGGHVRRARGGEQPRVSPAGRPSLRARRRTRRRSAPGPGGTSPAPARTPVRPASRMSKSSGEHRPGRRVHHSPGEQPRCQPDPVGADRLLRAVAAALTAPSWSAAVRPAADRSSRALRVAGAAVCSTTTSMPRSTATALAAVLRRPAAAESSCSSASWSHPSLREQVDRRRSPPSRSSAVSSSAGQGRRRSAAGHEPSGRRRQALGPVRLRSRTTRPRGSSAGDHHERDPVRRPVRDEHRALARRQVDGGPEPVHAGRGRARTRSCSVVPTNTGGTRVPWACAGRCRPGPGCGPGAPAPTDTVNGTWSCTKPLHAAALPAREVAAEHLQPPGLRVRPRPASRRRPTASLRGAGAAVRPSAGPRRRRRPASRSR